MLPTARRPDDRDDREESGSRERVVGAGPACPDDELWSLLVEGLLSSEASSELWRHAEDCQTCHLTLAGLGLVSEVDPARAATEVGASGTAAPGTSRRVDNGALVGRYVVVASLGEGGMGVVYKAYDPELDRHVALKLLKPSASVERDELVGRLQREARAMAKLSHPNVVTVHDVGKHEGTLYLAMELVQGGTLDAYLKQGKRRSLSEIARCFRDVARGLCAAHESRLVHRDLKPQNVLVSIDGGVKVTDFGLARSAAEIAADAEELGGDALALTATAITRTGQIVGTPAYMAPEQFSGAKTDARTDVFALGVALHEAVFGERPFAGSTIAELRANVLGGRRSPAPLPGLESYGLAQDPGVRVAFDDVTGLIDRCLSVDPSRRPSTLRELEEALERLRERVASQDVVRSEPSAPRSRRTLFVGMGLVMLATVGVGIGLRQSARLHAEPAPRALPSEPRGVEALPRMPAPAPLPAPANGDALGDPSPHVVQAVSAKVKAVVDAGAPVAVTPVDTRRGRRSTNSTAGSVTPRAPETSPNGAPILR